MAPRSYLKRRDKPQSPYNSNDSVSFAMVLHAAHFCGKLLMSEKLCPQHHKLLRFQVSLKKSYKENSWVLWMFTKSTQMKCSRFLVSWQMLSLQQHNCKSDEIIFSYGWFDAPSPCKKHIFTICFSILKAYGIDTGLHTDSKRIC